MNDKPHQNEHEFESLCLALKIVHLPRFGEHGSLYWFLAAKYGEWRLGFVSNCNRKSTHAQRNTIRMVTGSWERTAVKASLQIWCAKTKRKGKSVVQLARWCRACRRSLTESFMKDVNMQWWIFVLTWTSSPWFEFLDSSVTRETERVEQSRVALKKREFTFLATFSLELPPWSRRVSAWLYCKQRSLASREK